MNHIMNNIDIFQIETDIDKIFEDNALCKLSFGQAVWHLLSYIENENAKVFHSKTNSRQYAIFIDNILNYITHPPSSMPQKMPK